MKNSTKNILSLLTVITFVILAIASTNSISTTSQSPSEDVWYAGGTLHKASVYEWKNASEKNRLATCADFVTNIKKYHNESYKGDLVSLKRDAIQMMDCINETVKGNVAQNANMTIGEIATNCAILSGASY